MPSPSIRGLLTKQERQYLQGEAGDVSNPRKIRHHIRQRTKTALDDLALIAQHLEERDYTQLFDAENGVFPPDIQQSIHGTVAFLYRLAVLNGVDAEPIFWHGIQQGHTETHPNRVADVNLSIRSEAQEPILDSLPEKLESETRLTDIELRTLFSNPHVFPPETATFPSAETDPTTELLTHCVHELITERESELEVVASTRPDSSSQISPRPDLVLRDADDNLILIEILYAVTDPQDIQEMSEKLSEITVEDGDTAQVRKLIITLPGNDSPSDPSAELQGHVYEVAEDNTILTTVRFSDEAELLDLM